MQKEGRSSLTTKQRFLKRIAFARLWMVLQPAVPHNTVSVVFCHGLDRRAREAAIEFTGSTASGTKKAKKSRPGGPGRLKHYK